MLTICIYTYNTYIIIAGEDPQEKKKMKTKRGIYVSNPDEIRNAVRELIADNDISTVKWVATPDMCFVKRNFDGKLEYELSNGNITIYGDDATVSSDVDMLIITYDGKVVGSWSYNFH